MNSVSQEVSTKCSIDLENKWLTKHLLGNPKNNLETYEKFGIYEIKSKNFGYL